MNELFCNRIRALRLAQNYTQEQIADEIGVSRQKYARIENGVDSITLDILSKIAAVLGMTVGDITCVFDETPVAQYKSGSEDESLEKIFEMLEFFYANKHLYQRLQHRNSII